MAEQIESLSDRRAGGPAKYPWDLWMNGGAWRIEQGEDYEIHPNAMGGSIRRRADRLGKRARVHVFPNGRIEFQVFERQSAGEAAA